MPEPNEIIPVPEQSSIQVYDLSREDLVIRTYFTEHALANRMNQLLDTGLYSDPLNREIIKTIRGYIKKYNRIPTAQELMTGMASSGYSENVRNKFAFICNAPCTPLRQDYCISMLESFYQEQKFEQILMKQAEALHNHDTNGIKGMIPLCKEALNFSLHTSLGLNLVTDTKTALEKLRAGTVCIPSRISEIRKYTTQKKETEGTCGGWFRKCISLFIGQPNIGKTLVLCSEAAYAVSMGYNVLYVSLEMAEEKIWHRVAANLLDKDMIDVLDTDPDVCEKMIGNAKAAEANNMGIMNVKRVKTTTTPSDISAMVDEFQITHGVQVDLLVIDYLGIMEPDRHGSRDENMYRDGELKAEQIRDLCDERNIAGLSAIQFNRTGYRNLDAGMENVSGSAAYNNTADFMCTITSDEVLRSHNLYAHMIVKNRHGENNVPFCTRNDFRKMRWFDATADDVAICDAQRAAALTNPQGNNGGRRREPPPPQAPAIPETPPKPPVTAGTAPGSFPTDLI